jgi:hypothetical protein
MVKKRKTLECCTKLEVYKLFFGHIEIEATENTKKVKIIQIINCFDFNYTFAPFLRSRTIKLVFLLCILLFFAKNNWNRFGLLASNKIFK